MEKIIQRIKSSRMDAILKVQTTMLKAITDFMHMKDVMQLMPVIISPITDPLCHSVFDARIKYCDQDLQLTKSMLLHKQISLISRGRKTIYIMSLNIRLEIEFSQVDFEFKDKKKEDIMKFMEELFVYVIRRVKRECKRELDYLGSKIGVIAKATF